MIWAGPAQKKHLSSLLNNESIYVPDGKEFAPASFFAGAIDFIMMPHINIGFG